VKGTAPSRLRRSAAWRTKPTWQCQYTTGCKEPRGTFYYCPKHRAHWNKGQNATRGLRRQLGFCIYCTAPALHGYRRCQQHLDLARRNALAYVEKRKKARGWKLVRVKI